MGGGGANRFSADFVDVDGVCFIYMYISHFHFLFLFLFLFLFPFPFPFPFVFVFIFFPIYSLLELIYLFSISP